MSKVRVFICLLVSLIGLIEGQILLRCTTKDIGQRLAHPRSCSLFWSCGTDKRFVVRQCPKGLHFNERLQVCDLISRAGCTKEAINPFLEQCETCDCSVCCSGCATTPGSLTTPMLRTPIHSKNPTTPSETTPTSTENLTTVPETTPASTENLTTVPETTLASTENLTTVPETTLTSTENLTTVPETTPASTENLTTVPETTPASTEKLTTVPETTPSSTENLTTVPETTPSSTENLTTVSETNPASTENLTTIPETTPTSTEVLTSVPVTTSLTTQPQIPVAVYQLENCDSLCCGKMNAETFSMTGNCQSYIICQNQRQIIMNCPNNLHYNEATGNCDFPEKANCKSPYRAPIGPAAGPSGTHCSYGGRCVGESDGTLFPDENNACSSNYVVCQCECEVTRSCSAPLSYNSNIKSCDWPENVSNCS